MNIRLACTLETMGDSSSKHTEREREGANYLLVVLLRTSEALRSIHPDQRFWAGGQEEILVTNVSSQHSKHLSEQERWTPFDRGNCRDEAVQTTHISATILGSKHGVTPSPLKVVIDFH